MEKMETREVKAHYCDGCGAEATAHLNRCAFCKRELCAGVRAGSEHFAYSLEIYIRENGDRRHLYVCKDCRDKPVPQALRIGELLKAMISPEPFMA